MKYSSSATGSFVARHRIEGHPVCGRGDGHQYHVRITVTYEELDANGYPRGGEIGDLQGSLGRLLQEFNHRDLDVMIPRITSSAPGLAAYFVERLLTFRLTGLTKVEVWNEYEGGCVEIESRRA